MIYFVGWVVCALVGIAVLFALGVGALHATVAIVAWARKELAEVVVGVLAFFAIVASSVLYLQGMGWIGQLVRDWLT